MRDLAAPGADTDRIEALRRSLLGLGNACVKARVERPLKERRSPFNTSTHTLATGVEALAVALAEGARFQAIPAYITQAIRGGRGWEVRGHADEITSWDQRSQVVIQARTADPSGTGEVWQQRREYRWNGAFVLLTALDLARRMYLIKPPQR
ncbi:hypothetical protein ACFRAO_04235 [Streptomyces sp. NPDC056656]|uniref:hypothetical protein n=1 Tax=Streptomyces sp. NPDC056656 TaxID=3345895 RepID=UPI00368836DA